MFTLPLLKLQGLSLVHKIWLVMQRDQKCIYNDLDTRCIALQEKDFFLFLRCLFVFTCTSSHIMSQAKIVIVKQGLVLVKSEWET